MYNEVVGTWTFNENVTVQEFADELLTSLSELGRANQEYSHILIAYDNKGNPKYIAYYYDCEPMVSDGEQLYVEPWNRTEYDWEKDELLKTKGLKVELCEIVPEEDDSNYDEATPRQKARPLLKEVLEAADEKAAAEALLDVIRYVREHNDDDERDDVDDVRDYLQDLIEELEEEE